MLIKFSTISFKYWWYNSLYSSTSNRLAIKGLSSKLSETGESIGKFIAFEAEPAWNPANDKL